jgi:hypothetical protein
MALKTILCTKKYLTSHSLKIPIVIWMEDCFQNETTASTNYPNVTTDWYLQTVAKSIRTIDIVLSVFVLLSIRIVTAMDLCFSIQCTWRFEVKQKNTINDRGRRVLNGNFMKVLYKELYFIYFLRNIDFFDQELTLSLVNISVGCTMTVNNLVEFTLIVSICLFSGQEKVSVL